MFNRALEAEFEAVPVFLGDRSARLEGITPGAPLHECTYLDRSAVPEGLGIMFEQGRVVRIEAFDAGIRTASGATVGDSQNRIKELYPGRITMEPHHYVPEGHYLNYSPEDANDGGYGVVFETDGQTVTSFRTGTLSAIALVEG